MIETEAVPIGSFARPAGPALQWLTTACFVKVDVSDDEVASE